MAYDTEDNHWLHAYEKALPLSSGNILSFQKQEIGCSLLSITKILISFGCTYSSKLSSLN